MRKLMDEMNKAGSVMTSDLKERLVRAFKLTQSLDDMEVPSASSDAPEHDPQEWTVKGHLENAEAGENDPTRVVDPNPDVKGIVCHPDPEEDRRVKAVRASQPRVLRPDAPRPKPVARGLEVDTSGARGMAGAMAADRQAREQRQATLGAAYKPWPKSVEEVVPEVQERKSMAELASQTAPSRLDFYMNVGR